MAEIRINATGGVKLYDADDSHYAQIIAGTITANVDAITLGHDVVSIVDNLALTSDSAVLKFGADNDTTLTHTDGTGLTLNSTNKLCFNDVSQFVQGISATVLGLGATDEIDLTATTVDLNGTLNVSGVATFQATPVFPDGSLALADLDIDGGTDIGEAIVDADLFIIDNGAGGTNRKTVASRLKTYMGFGADQWRVTAEFDGSATPIASNWERSDTTGFSVFGTGLTESSGIFTFPSTGYWWIHAQMAVQFNEEDTDSIMSIATTTDNSSYTAQSTTREADKNTDGRKHSMSCVAVFDVTSTSNCKFRIDAQSVASSNTVAGSSAETITGVSVFRLGDT